MAYFGKFYLDQEKDIIITLDKDDEGLSYILSTPNHQTGNLITNLAEITDLPITYNDQGLKVIRGRVPCYIDFYGREVYIFRLNGTKVANIYPDGTISRKASMPAIAKTLMSQTKNYQLPFHETILKSYIKKEVKFTTDLHTHMNANLSADTLIALGVVRQIRYPLYYIKKLQLKLTPSQTEYLAQERKQVAEANKDCGLLGKYLERRIDDLTFINFADFILASKENAAYNIPRIRASLAIMKDGQAVFTNLEKVYLYRYVFTKGIESEKKIVLHDIDQIPDNDIVKIVNRMLHDKNNPAYASNSLYQDTLLWIARGYQAHGIHYIEMSDTALLKPESAISLLEEVHKVMPYIYAETGVRIRLLAAFRRIPLTLVKDKVSSYDFTQSLAMLYAVMKDPYVAGSDIVGEEINDIRDLTPLLKQIVKLASLDPGFVIRIHAGENDALRDNVEHSIRIIKDNLQPNQKMPYIRIGHGLYTASLASKKGKQLLSLIKETNTTLEFQITSNVRLNNLSDLKKHPLKLYLGKQINCVQGTDGAALYGTDSIDEQLSLETMLRLRDDELHTMHECEEKIRKVGEDAFARKNKELASVCKHMTMREYYALRTKEAKSFLGDSMYVETTLDTAKELSSFYKPYPIDKVPIIVAGGSFNSDARHTKVTKNGKKIIDTLLEKADPNKVFFVIGHRLNGYEKYLLEACRDKFEIFAIIPARLHEDEIEALKKAAIPLHFSIESAQMGLYKSFTHEIYKQRYSLTLAFDGNAGVSNLIQDGRNSLYRTYAFLNTESRVLKAKANTIEGYVTEMSADNFDEIMRRIEKAYTKMHEGA